MIFNQIKVLPFVGFILTLEIVGPYGINVIKGQVNTPNFAKIGILVS